MGLERFSHVMHLTSIVEGQLADDRDRLDALVSCFPAGTVSGAPKVRAMQIIRELEPIPRGPVRGRGRLRGLRRQSRLLHRDSDDHHVERQGLGAGGRRHRDRLEPHGRVRGDARQGARAAEGARTRAAGTLTMGHRLRHRQLRLVHLQPRAVPGRAGRRGARRAQRRGDGGRGGGHQARADRHFARARDGPRTPASR